MMKGSTQTYKIYRKLGQGGFGQVYLAKDVHGVSLVIKKIPIDHEKRGTAFNEVKIMKNVSHNNVISFYDSFVSRRNMVIVMEYAKGGDLSKFIKRRYNEPFPEELIWNIFLQITFGLRYLHSMHVLHRDVKTQNIFLMADGTVKIGDFGIGRMFLGDDQNAKTVIGTPYYLSPEICSGMPYGYKSDMWSLGCILYELCSLKRAFTGSNVCEVVRKITQSPPDPIPFDYSNVLTNVLNNLLSKRPEERYSADQICRIPSVKTIIRDTFDVQGNTTKIFTEMHEKLEESKGSEEERTNLSPKRQNASGSSSSSGMKKKLEIKIEDHQILES
ncbi:non-specific serine/threonine protein kinase [Entamoeba marina]